MKKSPKSILLGEHLFKSRRACGFTQKDMAERLEISAQFLGKIEKGEAPCPDPVLVKAIQLLDLTPAAVTKIYVKAAKLEAHHILGDLVGT